MEQHIGSLLERQMTNAAVNPWTTLKPPLTSKASQNAFAGHARALGSLARVCKDESADEVIEKERAEFVAEVKASRRGDRQALLAAGLVVTDLVRQGWEIRVRRDRVDL